MMGIFFVKMQAIGIPRLGPTQPRNSDPFTSSEI